MTDDNFTTLFKPLKKQHVCERCGKIRSTHCKVNFQIGNGFYRDIGWIAIRAGSGYERDVDLCEDCMKKLAEWFNKNEGDVYSTEETRISTWVDGKPLYRATRQEYPE